MPSEIAGTAFLFAILVISALIAFLKRSDPSDSRGVVPLACLTLAIQAVHCAEEFVTGFPATFPRLLGLEPWSPDFFVSFNLAWIAIWSLSLGAVSRGRSNWLVMTVFWFLGLAAVANGFAHPLLSLASANYFPGTVSAIPLGLCGYFLIRRMASAQRR